MDIFLSTKRVDNYVVFMGWNGFIGALSELLGKKLMMQKNLLFLFSMDTTAMLVRNSLLTHLKTTYTF